MVFDGRIVHDYKHQTEPVEGRTTYCSNHVDWTLRRVDLAAGLSTFATSPEMNQLLISSSRPRARRSWSRSPCVPGCRPPARTVELPAGGRPQPRAGRGRCARSCRPARTGSGGCAACCRASNRGAHACGTGPPSSSAAYASKNRLAKCTSSRPRNGPATNWSLSTASVHEPGHLGVHPVERRDAVTGGQRGVDRAHPLQDVVDRLGLGPAHGAARERVVDSPRPGQPAISRLLSLAGVARASPPADCGLRLPRAPVLTACAYLEP